VLVDAAITPARSFPTCPSCLLRMVIALIYLVSLFPSPSLRLPPTR
jgi:hypothetical protein